MGIKVKNPITYKLGDDIESYFDVEINAPIRDNDYELLKKEKYKLDIDYEEKANIINSISKLSTSISNKEKTELIKQIENFKKLYNL